MSSNIVIWNDTSGVVLHELFGHTAMVNGLKLINNDLLASSSDDYSIILWDLSTYTPIETLWWHNNWVYPLTTFIGCYFYS